MTRAVLTVLVVAGGALAGPGPQPDTPAPPKGVDLRRRVPFVVIPPEDPRNPFHWAWVLDQISTHRRFADDEPAPKDPGDLPDEPVDPCPNC